MKRSDLVVGQTYAICAPSRRSDVVIDQCRWRAGVTKATVLHIEPYEQGWVSEGLGLGRKAVFKPTRDGKGSGVHVMAPARYRPDGEAEDIVSLNQFWMTWEDWEVEKARREELVAKRNAAKASEQQEWAQRVEQVRTILQQSLGVEVNDFEAPVVHRDGSHSRHWKMDMATMEAIAGALEHEYV